MFWQKIRLNHRARLTTSTTLTVSVGLAVVFALVLAIVRSQTINTRFNELGLMANRIASEWKGPDSLAEEGDDFPEMSIAVYSLDRRLLASSTKRPLPFFTGNGRQGELVAVGRTYQSVAVVIGTSWRETERGLNQLALVLGILWLPLCLLTGVVSWYAGGRVLHPIQELVDSASKLSSAIDEERLTTTDQAEFSQLAAALNQMLERIHHSSRLQEQFASDAAHELRTPLAILRTRIETVLLKKRDSDEYQRSLNAMLIEVERLTHLIETLLVSARTPFDVAAPIDLALAVSQAAEEWLDRQEDPATPLDLRIDPVQASIDSDEVRIILSNLLDNARKHAPAGTKVKVILTTTDGKIFLLVSDDGPGLSEADRKAAFERFYRIDSARNRAEGGSGIGLSVVKRIVEARGGQVSFLPVEVGATVQITLPAVI